jgi:cellulose synthase (UDP-forming)
MVRLLKFVISKSIMIILLGIFLLMSLAMTIQTSLNFQFILGIILLLVLFILKPFMQLILFRISFFIAAGILVLRYYAWRIMCTLPDPGFSVEFVAAFILISVESIAIAQFFLSCFINLDPKTQSLAPKVNAKEFLDVDVFIPTYNEPINIIKNTALGACSMVYPSQKLNIHICDDGSTNEKLNSENIIIAQQALERKQELEALCKELGINYLSRENNKGAKAGNISSALLQTNSELVLVLDADHVPTRDFLASTVGYFEQPDLFLVQTPHHFINSDPIHRNLDLPDDCPPESEMFYSHTLRSLDSWDGTFFCGSAAVLRRAALEDIGGISGSTITEDAETALDLHARKWTSVYINKAMVCGLNPETFSAFITQRGRWATGMLQILRLKNPIFRSGLTLHQRLCYLNSISNWFFPLTRLTFIIAPLLFLFFGINFFVATLEEASVFTFSYICATFLTQNAVFNKVRWPLISEIYETAQAPFLIKNVFSVIWSPRKSQFNVTAKDEMIETDSVSTLHWPLTLLLIICFFGVVAFCFRWIAFPEQHGILLIVGLWGVFNFIIVSAAWQAILEKKNIRKSPRVVKLLPAQVSYTIEDEAVEKFEAKIQDVSLNGLKIYVYGNRISSLRKYFRSENTAIQVSQIGSQVNQIQTSIPFKIENISSKKDGLMVHCSTNSNLSPEEYNALVTLIYSSSSSWREKRTTDLRSRGLISGILFVLYISLLRLPGSILHFYKYYPTETNADHGVHDAETDLNMMMALEDEASNLTSEKQRSDMKNNSVLRNPTKKSLVQNFLLLVLPCFASLYLFGSNDLLAQTITLDRFVLEKEKILVNKNNILPSARKSLDIIDTNITEKINRNILAPNSLKQNNLIIPLNVITNNNKMKFLHSEHLFRMSGEKVSAEFEVFLPKFSTTSQFQVNLESSIHLLEAMSSIVVELNGVKILEEALGEKKGNVVLNIPNISAKEGSNRVNIYIQHTHRIYCGVAASFDIWTDLNLMKTGFVLDDYKLPPTVEGIISSVKFQTLFHPLSLRVDPDINSLMSDAIVNELSHLLSLKQKDIKLKTLWDPIDEFENIFRILISESSAESGGLSVGLDGVPVYTIVSLLDPIFSIIKQERAIGKITQEKNPILAELDIRKSIYSLGYKPSDDNASYGHESFNFVLPYDWASFGVRHGYLDLVYDYSQRLPKNANFSIKLNDAIVHESNIKVEDLARNISKRIKFNANVLKGGLNSFEFEFVVPSQNSNSVCNNFPEKFIKLKPSTSLFIPSTPMVYLDGIQNTLPFWSGENVYGEKYTVSGLNETKLKLALDASKTNLPKSVKQASASIAKFSSPKVYLIDSSKVDTIPSDEHFFSMQAIKDSVTLRNDLIKQNQEVQNTYNYDNLNYESVLNFSFWTNTLKDYSRTQNDFKKKIDIWLSNNQAQLLIFKPHSETNDIYIVINPYTSNDNMFDILAGLNSNPKGPSGALSVLGSDNKWTNFERPILSTPMLIEPLTIKNLWDVLGNYVSFYPVRFLALILLLGLILIVFTFLYIYIFRGRER